MTKTRKCNPNDRTYQHLRKWGHRFECLFVKEWFIVAIFGKEFLNLLAVSHCGRLGGHHEDQGSLASALLEGIPIPTPLSLRLWGQASRLTCLFEILIRTGGRKAGGKRRNQSQQPDKNECRESMGRKHLSEQCGGYGALWDIQKSWVEYGMEETIQWICNWVDSQFIRFDSIARADSRLE